MRRRALLLAGAGAARRAGAARAVARPSARTTSVAPGWRRDVLIRWGDRVAFDAPPWDPAQPSVDAAAAQFGWDARIIALIAGRRSRRWRAARAAGGGAPDGRGRAWPSPAGATCRRWPARCRASRCSTSRSARRWTVVDGGFQNRRLTAGDAVPRGLRMATLAAGLVGVTGGCATPWGSLLLTEGDAPRLARAAAGARRRHHRDGGGDSTRPNPLSVPVEARRAGPLRAGRCGRRAVGRWPRRGLADRWAGRRAPLPLRLGRGGGDAGAGCRAAWRRRASRAGPCAGCRCPRAIPIAAARSRSARPASTAPGASPSMPRAGGCAWRCAAAPAACWTLRAAAGDAAAETGVAETLIDGIAVAMPDPRAPAAARAGLALGAGHARLRSRMARCWSAPIAAPRPGPLPEALYRVPVDGRGSRPRSLPAGGTGGCARWAARRRHRMAASLAAIAHPGAAPGATSNSRRRAGRSSTRACRRARRWSRCARG